MDKPSTRFVTVWALVWIALVGGVVGVNVTMDPYLILGMPRIAGVNRSKPAVDGKRPFMMSYDVLRAAPNTVLVGNSRVEAGLAAENPAWPESDRPVYNLGVPAGSPYVGYRYLQHVMAQHHLSLVVLGLDFEYFLTVEEADRHVREHTFESRLVVTQNGMPNPGWRSQHIRDTFQAVFSLDALSDSVATLTANLSDGTADAVDLGSGDMRIAGSYGAIAGSYTLVVASDLGTILGWRGKTRNRFAMADLRSILDLCQSHETRLILFMDPAHADELEILDAVGYWKEFEGWKRDIVALIAEYQRSTDPSPIQLWDFTGYDSYSSEAVLTDPHRLRWYLEPRHYTKALGDAIVRRILGSGDANFGTLLTPNNLERHLAVIREQQRLYREHQPADARRVRDLYNFAAGIHSRSSN